MGLIDRLGRVIRAGVNNLVGGAEDPEKVLEEAVSQMEQHLIGMRQALAEAIATQKRTDRQIQQHQKLATTWHERARTAMGNDNESLAREALSQWQTHQNHLEPLQKGSQQHGEVIKKLKQELLTIERKYIQIKAQKSLYVARLQSASASQKAREIIGEIEGVNAGGVFEKIEAKVLLMEAEAQLLIEDSDPVEVEFRRLERQKQLEAELGNIKNQEM
ncbi:MAG: Phage shock protein A [Chroococcopsis gigantea SAG 12.99]|jgi:phage shock protein A|nr:Phage shock protein A [Chroococcopsis gigantea SAG 12.99]